MKELKITIKFNVNFLSMSLKDTFCFTMSVFLIELWTSRYIFIIIKMLVIHFS